MAATADVANAVSRAGHDLNNLCASMLGFAALAQEAIDEGSPARVYLVEIEAAAERASHLATELRQLSLLLHAGPNA